MRGGNYSVFPDSCRWGEATIAFFATLARFSLGHLGDPPYLCRAKALASQPPCAGAVN